MSIPTALFLKRRRDREPGASARYSVRRAAMARRSGGKSGAGRPPLLRRPLGAGTSLMARSGTGQILLRRRPLAACREDRMSALPDDLLRLVLDRLDTRSALGTGMLSRRWAHLPRELAALDLRAVDMLPPRYHRLLCSYIDIRNKATVLHYRPGTLRKLAADIRRYERRAMCAFTSAMESFLEGRPRRRVNRLRLGFVTIGNAGSCMNRLVAEAIDAWGVEDLEAGAKPWFNRQGPPHGQDGIHSFPSHGLCKEPRASRLRSLKLGGCVLPPLHEYGALTTLILQDIPDSTPAAAYEGVFILCPQLQTLHLISCSCRTSRGVSLTVVVDSPGSQIRELVVDRCTYFRKLVLKALPCLESVASIQSRVSFKSTSSFPCLIQRNLTMRLGVELQGVDWRLELELDGMFFDCTPDIRSLIIRFTGPDRWIVPSSSPSELLPNLKRLLVADVPSSWDVTWPRLLLEMTPNLETLHIHIVHGEEEPAGEEIPWSSARDRELWPLHHLKEFVVAGFEGTARQIYLVKLVVRACTALRLVAMFRNGHVRYRGHWDWEMVTLEHYSWSDEDKSSVFKQIMDGVSSTAHVQLVLG